MRYLLFPFLAFVIAAMPLHAQHLPKHKPAYRIFKGNGKKTSYRKMVRQLGRADVVFFGELHNNPIAHWMELALVKDLRTIKPVIIGTEMVERDQQEVLERYLSGDIDAKALDTLAKWPVNFKTDYKPLIDYAKAHKLKYIGTNIPRRFAHRVFRGGFEVLDSLSAKEKSWVAPLPVDYDPDLPSYKAMLEMMGSHSGANLPKAQAIKDATMAHFISQNMEAGKLFFHFNGSYHTNNDEGIIWYLKRLHPDLNYRTVSLVTQNQLKKLDEENVGIADFIIVVDEDVTTSY